MPLRPSIVCPQHNICETYWHWTAASREGCRRRQEANEERRHLDDIDRRNNVPFAIRAKEEKEHAEDLANHHAVEPSLPQDAVIVRNGERQLTGMTSMELGAIGVLMSTDVVRINAMLRCGRKLGTPGPASGSPRVLEKFTSEQQIVDVAVGAISKIGPELSLDEPVRLFRGIGIAREPTQEFPDIAGIRSYLDNSATGYASAFTDTGFGFACVNPVDALTYDGEGDFSFWQLPVAPLLFQLDVRAGLCLPGLEYRSQALFGRCRQVGYLDRGSNQVIFPPGTQWKVITAKARSAGSNSSVMLRPSWTAWRSLSGAASSSHRVTGASLSKRSEPSGWQPTNTRSNPQRSTVTKALGETTYVRCGGTALCPL